MVKSANYETFYSLLLHPIPNPRVLTFKIPNPMSIHRS